MSGTSQATPFVTGASMLVRQALHDFMGVDVTNKDRILQILKDSADHVTDAAGSPDHDNVTNTDLTFDRLNIYSAIQSVIDLGNLTDDLADGQAIVSGSFVPGNQREFYTFQGHAGDLLTVTLDDGSLTDWLDSALAIFSPGQTPAYVSSQTATDSFLRYSWETNKPMWPNSKDPRHDPAPSHAGRYVHDPGSGRSHSHRWGYGRAL